MRYKMIAGVFALAGLLFGWSGGASAHANSARAVVDCNSVGFLTVTNQVTQEFIDARPDDANNATGWVQQVTFNQITKNAAPGESVSFALINQPGDVLSYSVSWAASSASSSFSATVADDGQFLVRAEDGSCVEPDFYDEDGDEPVCLGPGDALGEGRVICEDLPDKISEPDEACLGPGDALEPGREVCEVLPDKTPEDGPAPMDKLPVTGGPAETVASYGALLVGAGWVLSRLSKGLI